MVLSLFIICMYVNRLGDFLLEAKRWGTNQINICDHMTPYWSSSHTLGCVGEGHVIVRTQCKLQPTHTTEHNIKVREYHSWACMDQAHVLGCRNPREQLSCPHCIPRIMPPLSFKSIKVAMAQISFREFEKFVSEFQRAFWKVISQVTFFQRIH